MKFFIYKKYIGGMEMKNFLNRINFFDCEWWIRKSFMRMDW
jgi:hypothetical protein